MPRPRRLGPDVIGSALAGVFQQLGGAFAARITEGRRRDRAGEILEELDAQKVTEETRIRPGGRGERGFIQPGAKIDAGVKKAPLLTRQNAQALAELQRTDPAMYQTLLKLDEFERSQKPTYSYHGLPGGGYRVMKTDPATGEMTVAQERVVGKERPKVVDRQKFTYDNGTTVEYVTKFNRQTGRESVQRMVLNVPQRASDTAEDKTLRRNIMQAPARIAGKEAAFRAKYPNSNPEAILAGEEKAPLYQKMGKDKAGRPIPMGDPVPVKEWVDFMETLAKEETLIRLRVPDYQGRQAFARERAEARRAALPKRESIGDSIYRRSVKEPPAGFVASGVGRPAAARPTVSEQVVKPKRTEKKTLTYDALSGKWLD